MHREGFEVSREKKTLYGWQIKKIAKQGTEKDIPSLARHCRDNFSWEAYCGLVQVATRVVNNRAEKEAIRNGESQFLAIFSVEKPARCMIMDCDMEKVDN